MGREQSQKLAKKRQLEKDLKSVSGQYKSDILGAEADIERISSRLSEGWEMRVVRCFIADHRPEGYRLLIRLDNGHIAKQRALTPEERQLKLTTEPPRKFVAFGVLHVDDENWKDVEAYEMPLYDDEFEALRTLDVIHMRPWSVALIESPKEDEKAKDKKTKRS